MDYDLEETETQRSHARSNRERSWVLDRVPSAATRNMEPALLRPTGYGAAGRENLNP